MESHGREEARSTESFGLVVLLLGLALMICVVVPLVLLVGLVYQEQSMGAAEERNDEPLAVLKVSPTAGNAKTTFEFDATGSRDVEDGEKLEARWDFDGDGKFEQDWQPLGKISRQYRLAGAYNVCLEVKDSAGKTGSASARVTVAAVSNTPPQVIVAYTRNPEKSRHPRKFLEYEFDAEGSSDREDKIDELKVRWDFDGDRNWDTEYASSKKMRHAFQSFGTYSVTAEICDSQGATALGALEIRNTVAEVRYSVHKSVKEDRCVECHYPSAAEEPPHQIDETASCVDCHKLEKRH